MAEGKFPPAIFMLYNIGKRRKKGKMPDGSGRPMGEKGFL